VFGQDPLAAERTVPVTAPVGITAYVSICVTDIVPVLLVEGIVCDLAKALSPENQTFF
jgi:hypothetical protein